MGQLLISTLHNFLALNGSRAFATRRLRNPDGSIVMGKYGRHAQGPEPRDHLVVPDAQEYRMVHPEM